MKLFTTQRTLWAALLALQSILYGLANTRDALGAPLVSFHWAAILGIVGSGVGLFLQFVGTKAAAAEGQGPYRTLAERPTSPDAKPSDSTPGTSTDKIVGFVLFIAGLGTILSLPESLLACSKPVTPSDVKTVVQIADDICQEIAPLTPDPNLVSLVCNTANGVTQVVLPRAAWMAIRASKPLNRVYLAMDAGGALGDAGTRD